MNLEYFDGYPKRNLTVTCYHDKDDKGYECLRKAFFQCSSCTDLLRKKGCDQCVNLCALCCIDYSDAKKGNVCPDEEMPELCHPNSWHVNADVSICKVDRMNRSSGYSQNSAPALFSDFSQVKRRETRVSSLPFPSHPSLHPFPSQPSVDRSGDSDSSSDIEVIPAAKKSRTLNTFGNSLSQGSLLASPLQAKTLDTSDGRVSLNSFIASPLEASPTSLLEGEVLATPEESIPSSVSPLTHDPFGGDHSTNLDGTHGAMDGGDHSTDLDGTHDAMDDEIFDLPYIVNIDNDEDTQASLIRQLSIRQPNEPRIKMKERNTKK